jgi:hypothetical protein
MSEERCIHEMIPSQCSICLHGPTKRATETHVSLCKSCEAEIIWCKTENGKAIPIDIEPSPQGRFRKERVDPVSGDRIVHYVKEPELVENTARLYSTHFETCEFADLHRKGK